MKLRAGVHPVTGSRLPMAVDSCGSAVGGDGRYSRLHAKTVQDTSFIQYVPEELKKAEPSGGYTAQEKRQLMQGRIRCKQARVQRQVRKARKKDMLMELQDLISTFIAEPAGRAECSSAVVHEQVNSDEEFWNSLPVDEGRRERILSIPSPPTHDFRGKALRSRCKQPVVHRRAELSRRCTVLTCFEFGCNGGHS